jgi:predicted HicB family RNase H-like nuclease
MKPMNYNGYAARIEYSDEDGCFVGHIAGIRDVVGFHATNVRALKKAFEEAVDDYLATCERVNRKPQRPYSGKVMLRIDPQLHAQAAMAAEAQGKSLNQWASDRLSDSIRE